MPAHITHANSQPAALILRPFWVSAGSDATLQVEPEKVFRADFLILERPEAFAVLELRVGNMLQTRSQRFNEIATIFPKSDPAPALSLLEPGFPDGIPARLFVDMAAAGIPMRFDTCMVAMLLTLKVRNVSSTTQVIAGRFIGVELL